MKFLEGKEVGILKTYFERCKHPLKLSKQDKSTFIVRITLKYII